LNRGIFILAGRIKALCIGGTGSGTGKTTLTLALLAALRRRGLVLQPYKIGPDFIDPGHHYAASGRLSHNLDTWMLRPDENRAIFHRYAAEADIAVVEGVMGIFDGLGPLDETGSTAHLTKLLGIPALLTIHAKGMARSIAALAAGFQDFDPDLIWAGAIANKCGSAGHIEILRQAMAGNGTMPLLGGLIRDDDIAMPERHLGLITADEGRLNEDALERLADLAEQGLDLDQLMNDLPSLQAQPPNDDAPKQADVRIGVARDQAFCFYYEENLRRLREAGAELVFFSPLRDKCLPAGLDGLHLGGGYPELFAKELSQNQGMLKDIAQAAKDGLPIFGECGGMMYLGRSVIDLEGVKWPLCGVLPIETVMNRKLRKLGYREATFTRDTPLGPRGTKARGHEFHYSEVSTDHGSSLDGVFRFRGRGKEGDAELGTAGFHVANTIASYMHFHFGSNHQLADNFVDFCRSVA
jgi:cobyrinic acid a,c-diamide synthase